MSLGPPKVSVVFDKGKGVPSVLHCCPPFLCEALPPLFPTLSISAWSEVICWFSAVCVLSAAFPLYYCREHAPKDAGRTASENHA